MPTRNKMPKLHIRSKPILFVSLVLLTCVTYALLAFNPSEQPQQSPTAKNPITHSGYAEQNYTSFQTVSAPPLPSKPLFCGEEVAVQDPEVAERLDREFTVNSFLHGSTLLLLKKQNRYFPVIEPILKEKNIPDDIKYLCVAESGLAHVVSPAGARGFWQFMKNTAQEYGLYVDNQIDERYDIVKSTYAACEYLLNSKKKLGTWSLAAAAYNAGNHGIQKQLNKQQVDSYYDLLLNAETSRYVFRIVALKYILANPQKYGFHIPKEDLYTPFEYEEIRVSDPLVDWIEFAQKRGISYKTLIYHNPHIRNHVWNNRLQKTITLYLPKN